MRLRSGIVGHTHWKIAHIPQAVTFNLDPPKIGSPPEREIIGPTLKNLFHHGPAVVSEPDPRRSGSETRPAGP